MNAILSSGLPRQRESDAQRRVDHAVRFAVWACAQPVFPTPAEIAREFGVSRGTCSRWRKALARALAAGATLPHGRRRPVAPVRASSKRIAERLASEPALLSVPVPVLVRDVRRRYGCSVTTARKAVAMVSRGASA